MSTQHYLLDTNICIAILKNKFNVRKRVESVGFSNCFVSEISLAELYYGAYKSVYVQKMIDDVKWISNHFEIIPISNSLDFYGKTKSVLEKSGTIIDNFDLLIGATAVVNNFIMVSENFKHLKRIPNIQIENWIVRE